MSASDMIKKLHKEIEGTGLEAITMPDGHIKVIGGEVAVDWWPDSKRMSAYAEGAPRGIKYATPRMVVQMAKGEHP
jgi:hypothetical protein